MAVTVCSPLAVLQHPDGIYLLKSIGVIYLESFETEYPTWGIVSIAALSALLAFISIFLFKKRKLQMKLCNINTILIMLFYITFGTYLYTGMNALGVEFLSIKYGIILPLIALIFNILATIKIKADEKLVRSLDRIR